MQIHLLQRSLQNGQQIFLKIFVICQFVLFSLLLYILLCFFFPFLDLVDLGSSGTLHLLDHFDEIVDILQVFEKTHLVYETSRVSDGLTKTAVDLGLIFRVCEVYFMGEVIVGVDDEGSEWVYFVYDG